MAATLTGTGAFSFSSPSFPFPGAAAFPEALVLARATSPDVPVDFAALRADAWDADADFWWMYRPVAEAATTRISRMEEKTKARLRREVEGIWVSGSKCARCGTRSPSVSIRSTEGRGSRFPVLSGVCEWWRVL